MQQSNKPNYRVTPWKNWCNDPNGLLFDGTKYHAFYQHYPTEPIWGPMHWGHATSQDLYRWEHQPIGIFPDDLGYCFSGSSVKDTKNTSGLRRDGQDPIFLFYTSHPATAPGETSYEMQSIAISYDGIHYEKYEGNPILENQGIADFRDPKVVWYEPGQHWIMALAVFDHIEFYRSHNLLDWTYASSFGPGENSINGIWECPDLFPLEYEGKTYWILIVSMGTDQASGRAITQYFVGDFDGTTYTSLEQTDYSRLIDEGPDNYAAVGFSGVEQPLMLGWAINWAYADSTPTDGWIGQMTAPRAPYLYRDKNEHIAMAFRPVPMPEDTIEESRVISISEVPTVELAPSSFVLKFVPDYGQPAYDIIIGDVNGEHVRVSQDEKRNLTVDRSKSGDVAYHEYLQDELYLSRTVEPRTTTAGECIITFDGVLLEVYSDEGSRIVTMVCYPSKPYSSLTLSGIENATLEQLKPYEAPHATDYYVNAK